jgi:rhodanese-related sulfurtransferase
MDGPKAIRNIDVEAASQQLRGSPEPLLVDVREPDEFVEQRVPGSVLVPLSDFAERFAELPSDRPLLILCATGRRSMVAADHLVRNGYPDVANVMGGIVAWRTAGLPVKGGRPDPGEGQLTGEGDSAR